MRKTILPATICCLVAFPAAGGAQSLLDTLAELATPDPMHAHLVPFAGEWSVSGQLWMDDGSTVPVSATLGAELLHGGLFLRQRLHGSLDDLDYAGEGILGYDIATGEFVEVWFESIAPGITLYRGTCEDPGCERMTLRGRFVDPVWGNEMASRIVVEWIDADTYRHESWLAHADGREFRQLEYTAVRVR